MTNEHSDDDYNSCTLAAVTTISNVSSKMKTEEPGIEKIYAKVHLNDTYKEPANDGATGTIHAANDSACEPI